MSNQQCLFLVSNVFAQDILRKKIHASKLSRILSGIVYAAIHTWLGHKKYGC